MDPNIWQRLPTDLLIYIIEADSSKRYSDGWIAATKGNRLLKGAAMANRWKHLLILDSFSRDIDNDPIMHWTQISGLTQLDDGLQPANYVKAIKVIFEAGLLPRPQIISDRAEDPGSLPRLESWIDLRYFQNLTSLDLSLARADQWEGLVRQISRLQYLKEFKASTFDLDVPWDLGGPSKGTQSPLEVILGCSEYDLEDITHEQNCNLLGNLPVSLRKLTIRDLLYIGERRLKIADAPANIQSYSEGPPLEELHVELTERTNTLRVLSWLPAASLKRISFSCAPYRALNEPENPIEAFRIVDDVIDKHKGTLREIILTNTLMTSSELSRHFNSAWTGRFQITDLVLSEWDWPGREDCKYAHEPFAELDEQPQELKHLLFGCDLNTSRWGDHIVRLRLELNFIAEMDFEEDFPSFSDFCMPLLRILIVAPRSDIYIRNEDEDEEDEEVLPILQNILKSATQDLRYVSLGPSAYWIDHGQTTSTHNPTESIVDRSNWRSVTWKSAISRQDKRVHSEVLSWLDQDDRDFIYDNSHLNRARSHWREQNTVIQCYLSMGNFVVARRC